MRVNLTVLTKDRPRLTHQTLSSLVTETSPEHPIMVLDDMSEMSNYAQTVGLLMPYDNAEFYQSKSGGAGIARNKVIKLAEKNQGRQDLLYISDSDCYFAKRWLDILTDVWPQAHALGFRVMGGWSHVYNAQSIGVYPAYSESARRTIELRECLAVATQSWLMDWETWQEFGPFDEAPGVRQSEDVAFCNRVRAKGYKVGYTWPFLVYSTSKTDTFGQQVPGAETIVAPEGVLIL